MDIDEVVKKFEEPTELLTNTQIIVWIAGLIIRVIYIIVFGYLTLILHYSLWVTRGSGVTPCVLTPTHFCILGMVTLGYLVVNNIVFPKTGEHNGHRRSS